jgi:hypothetical protein
MTPNLRGYTADKFAEDITAVLPFAFPELHELGRMTTCGQCGATHDGIHFVVHKCTELDNISEVEVVAVCNTCATSPAMLPPNEWSYVCETSGLFVPEENWALYVKTLRSIGAWVLRKKWGLPLVSKLLHADDIPSIPFNAVVFFQGDGDRLREIPCVFPWHSGDLLFIGGKNAKAALDARLDNSMMFFLGPRAGTLR